MYRASLVLVVRVARSASDLGTFPAVEHSKDVVREDTYPVNRAGVASYGVSAGKSRAMPYSAHPVRFWVFARALARRTRHPNFRRRVCAVLNPQFFEFPLRLMAGARVGIQARFFY